MIKTRWPDTWKSYQIIYDICQNIDKPNRLVVEPAWMDAGDAIEYLSWVLEDPDYRDIVFVNCVDPDEIQSFAKLLGYRYFDVKEFWLMAFHRYHKPVNTEPQWFKYPFLCYQRKMYPAREKIYHTLVKYPGIVTRGDREYEFNKDFAYSATEVDPVDETHRVSPDAWGLGNLQIWNTSFLNIVSETRTNWSPVSSWIVSEKTWKPVFGMRPFIIAGAPAITHQLKTWGFKTFDEEFDYDNSSPRVMARQIEKVVKQLQQKPLGALYDAWRPHFDHNMHTAQSVSRATWTKFAQMHIPHQPVDVDRLRYIINKLSSVDPRTMFPSCLNLVEIEH